MQSKFIVKAFFSGFLFAIFCFIFFIHAKIPDKHLKGFYLIKLDLDSVTPEFFSSLKKIEANVVTSESLGNLFSFENKIGIFEEYFTEEKNYYNWFFNDAKFENIYVKKTFNPIKKIRLYNFLSKNSKQFYIEEDLSKNFFSFFVLLIFFAVLIFYSDKKIKFAFLSISFLLFSFFAKSFISLSSCFLILYAIYFSLELSSFKYKYINEKLKVNSLLLLLFLLGVFLNISNFFSNLELFWLFLASLGMFFCIVFFVIGIKSLKDKNISLRYAEDESNEKILVKSFLTFDETINISLFAIIVFSASFLYFFTFNSRLNGNKFLYAVTANKVTASFSKQDFFKIEETKNAKNNVASLNDFVRDCWFNIALDYSKLYEKTRLEKDSVIYYNDFVFLDGRIREVENKLLAFDDAFIRDCLTLLLQNSEKNSLYKVLLAQKAFADFSLQRFSVDYDAELFQVIVFLFSIIILAFVIFMSKKQKRKNTEKISLYEYQGN